MKIALVSSRITLLALQVSYEEVHAEDMRSGESLSALIACLPALIACLPALIACLPALIACLPASAAYLARILLAKSWLKAAKTSTKALMILWWSK